MVVLIPRPWASAIAPFAAGAALLAGVFAGAAQAINLFTLDPQADSIGPIVTDAAGNGYVAWLRTGVPDDSTMFCKLPPGARGCANPITLAPPGSDPTLNTPSQPFAVLGGAGTPAGSVYVVENRYVANDTVIWKSTDGGQTFGGPDDIGAGCYSGNTDIDDVLWWNGSVGFVTGAHNPGLGYGFSVYGETCAGPAATPGTGPGQGATGWQFGNPGGGGVGSATLGFASNSDPRSDQVEAYSLLTTLYTVDFFRFSAPNLPPGTPGDFASTLPSNWAGPTKLTDGYLPRLAGGPAGLFLVTEDYTEGNAYPSAVNLRKYDPVHHVFGSPTTLVTDPQNQVQLFDGGGLGENPDTGELVAAWPGVRASDGAAVMRLWTSTDGGSTFSPQEDIAILGGGYTIEDNARLAVADNGQGFLTFQDSEGLKVADLTPFLIVLSLGSGRTPKVPVRCGAVTGGKCKVKASILFTKAGKHHHTRPVTIATGHGTIAGGNATELPLRLTAAGRHRLATTNGPLDASLTVIIHLQHPSRGPQHTITPVTVQAAATTGQRS
jgi:hypothetical protein